MRSTLGRISLTANSSVVWPMSWCCSVKSSGVNTSEVWRSSSRKDPPEILDLGIAVVAIQKTPFLRPRSLHDIRVRLSPAQVPPVLRFGKLSFHRFRCRSGKKMVPTSVGFGQRRSGCQPHRGLGKETTKKFVRPVKRFPRDPRLSSKAFITCHISGGMCQTGII